MVGSIHGWPTGGVGRLHQLMAGVGAVSNCLGFQQGFEAEENHDAVGLC